MLYEINYLVLQSKAGDLVGVKRAVKESIAVSGGVIKEEKEFLKRKLAYRIEKENYGFHTVLRFEMENAGECISQLKKKLDLSLKIARYIIVKADKMPSLKDFFIKEKENKFITKGDTIKQEDVNKILASEDRAQKLVAGGVKKIDGKEVAEKVNVPKRKNSKIIQEEEMEKTKREKAVDAGKNKKLEKNKTEVVDKDNVSKDNEKKKTKRDKDEKISLDDLDEKLDEILNI